MGTNLTDMGNAQRLARLFGDRIRFSKHLGWFVYNGKKWTPDDESQVQGYAKETVRQVYAEAAQEPDEAKRKKLADFAMKCESVSRVGAMIQLLPSEPGISVLPEVFDRDKMLLNVANGTLDLRSGQPRPHSPDDLITKLAPVEYDPKAECPRWEAFLNEIMNDDTELVGFLQRLFGYSLTGLTSEQVWFFLWGKGANGKSTLVDVVAHVLGDYQVNTPPETFLETSGSGIRNDLARLRGARIITASEPMGKKFDPAVLKSFTGQDPITARFLNKEFFEYVPEGKLFFSANHRPDVRDTSHGFWRRVILIPFTRVFTGSEQEEGLRDQLKAEASGIFNWLLQGCLAWQKHRLDVPPDIRLAVNDYRNATDVLADFLETHCALGNGLTTPVRDLYARYCAYCEERSIRRPMSNHRFNDDLLGRASITKGLIGPKAKRVKTWFGIGLQETALQACSSCNLEGEPCRKLGIQHKNAMGCKYYEAYC